VGDLGAERGTDGEGEEQPLFLPTPSFMASVRRRGIGSGGGSSFSSFFLAFVISWRALHLLGTSLGRVMREVAACRLRADCGRETLKVCTSP